MNRLIDFIIRRYRIVLVLIILITIPFAYYYYQQEPFNHLDVFFDKDDPDLLYYKKFQKTYGNEEMGILVFRDENVFSKENIEIIRKISEMAKKTEGVQRVISLTEAEISRSTADTLIFEKIIPEEGELTPEILEKAKKRVLDNEIYKRSIISDDGLTTAITIELEPISSNEKKRELLRNLKREAEKIAGDTVDLHFTGAPFIEVEINRLTKLDNKRFTPLGVLVIFIIIAFLLKRISLAFMAEINIFLALLWGIGMLTLCGERMNIVTVIIPPVLLAISVAASIHILSHYRTLHVIEGFSHIDAVSKSLKSLWYPCLFTSLTTGIGFLSFITTNVRPVKVVGIYTSIGVIYSFILTIAFLPVALIIMRKRLENLTPAEKKLKEISHATEEKGVIDYEDKGIFFSILKKVGTFTVNNYIPVSIISAIIIIVSIIGMFQMRYETNFANYLPETNQIKKDINFVEENLGGSVPVVMLIKAKSPENDFTHPETLRMLEHIQEDAMEFMDGRYTWTFSVADYIKEIHMAYNSGTKKDYHIPERRMDVLDYYEISDSEDIGRILSPDYMEARISFVARLGQSTEVRTQSEKLRKRIKEFIGDEYIFNHTGSGPLYGVMEINLKNSQIRSFGSAFVVIFIMMWVICRHFILTVVSMIPNIFPIVFTLGVMGWFNVPLDVSTIMIASITIGIAVDDTIHFLTWFRRNTLAGMDTKTALMKTYKDTGKPIVITSVVLCCVYLILVMGSIKPVIAFGILASISMFFALVGDLLVLPAVLLVFKPKIDD